MYTIYFLKAYHTGTQSCPVLTQYHQVPTSTALYWPRTTKCRSLLTKYNQVPIIIAQYDQVPTSTAYYWPSTSKHQQLLPSTDPVSPSTDQYLK